MNGTLKTSNVGTSVTHPAMKYGKQTHRLENYITCAQFRTITKA
jgi:hypothetical protein